MTITSQRHLFDIPDDIAYFNCAYNSPQLIESRQRLFSGVSLKCHPWERTAQNFFEDAENIRKLAAEIFGGEIDGYAIIPAASYGISTAARAIEPELQKGDNILIMAEEFPSNVLPWKRVCHERGSKIVTVSLAENGNWTQAIIDKIDNSIKVAALSTCHWTNGAYIDLSAVRNSCDKTGTVLVVDATQTLGAMPFPMEDVRPDFLIAAGYKWLLCPYGFSLMYISEKWRNSRPLEESWLARENAEDFSSLVNYSDEYLPGARRFDVGEKCTSTILPGAVAALEQIRKWGVQQIAESLSGINMKLASHLAGLGFQLPDETQRCPHMFGAIIPENYKENLVLELKDHEIYISQRGRSVRFAPHLHINDYDLSRLLDVLTDIISR
jgi:selenocysteine lyase/cysteine desulfurase